MKNSTSANNKNDNTNNLIKNSSSLNINSNKATADGKSIGSENAFLNTATEANNQNEKDQKGIDINEIGENSNTNGNENKNNSKNNSEINVPMPSITHKNKFRRRGLSINLGRKSENSS